jgi:hypothetical protein
MSSTYYYASINDEDFNLIKVLIDFLIYKVKYLIFDVSFYAIFS